MTTQMLSTQDAADFLNVSTRTLSRMKQEYPLICKKVDRQCFYTKGSLAKAKKIREKAN